MTPFKGRTHSACMYPQRQDCENISPLMYTLNSGSRQSHFSQFGNSHISNHSLNNREKDRLKREVSQDNKYLYDYASTLKSFTKPKFVQAVKPKGHRDRNKTLIEPMTSLGMDDKVRNLSVSQYCKDSQKATLESSLIRKNKWNRKREKFINKSIIQNKREYNENNTIEQQQNNWKTSLRNETIEESRMRKISKKYVIKRIPLNTERFNIKAILESLYKHFIRENKDSMLYEDFIAKLEALGVISNDESEQLVDNTRNFVPIINPQKNELIICYRKQRCSNNPCDTSIYAQPYKSSQTYFSPINTSLYTSCQNFFKNLYRKHQKNTKSVSCEKGKYRQSSEVPSLWHNIGK